MYTFPEVANRYAVAFSLYTNLGKVFALQPVKAGSSTMTSMNGLRAMSMMWVVLGHSFIVTAAGPQINYFDRLEVKRCQYIDYILIYELVCPFKSGLKTP